MTTRNQRDLDHLLGDGGGELGALYGRLSKAQPPRRLDRQILAEASRAVHGRPKGARWLLGLGTAAGVLLAAGIAWRVNTDLIRQRDGATTTAPAAAPMTTHGSDVIPIQAIEAPASRSSGSPSISNKGFDGASDGVVSGSRVAAPKTFTPSRDESALRERKSEAVKRIDDAGPVGAAAPAPMAAEPEAFAPPPPAPPPPAAMSTQADAAPSAARNDAPQELASGVFKHRASRAAPAPLSRAAESQTAAADMATMAAERDEAKAALPGAGDNHDAAIARIRALLAENRRDDALAAVRELRRQQPTLVLPDDLRALER